MKRELYNCIFEGEIADNCDIQEVKTRLCALFHVHPERIDALIVGGPVIVRKSVDRETASHYEKAFERAGATLRIVPLDADPVEVVDSSPRSEQAQKVGRIRRYLERTKSYSDLRLVVELSLVSFPLKIFAAVPAILLGAKAPEQKLEVSLGELFLLTVIAPLVETLLGQWAPMKIASYFTSRPSVLVTVSAMIFAAAHWSPAHGVSAYPAGLGLAWAFAVGLVLAWIFFIKRSESVKKAFELTAASHALHNFIAFSAICLGSAIEG